MIRSFARAAIPSHHQFFSNSTGIVWKDALAGFETLGLTDYASTLRAAAARAGGEPSMDRGEREPVMEKLEPEDFEDLDDSFFELEARVDLASALLKHIRQNPQAFHFAGAFVRRSLRG